MQGSAADQFTPAAPSGSARPAAGRSRRGTQNAHTAQTRLQWEERRRKRREGSRQAEGMQSYKHPRLPRIQPGTRPGAPTHARTWRLALAVAAHGVSVDSSQQGAEPGVDVVHAADGLRGQQACHQRAVHLLGGWWLRSTSEAMWGSSQRARSSGGRRAASSHLEPRVGRALQEEDGQEEDDKGQEGQQAAVVDVALRPLGVAPPQLAQHGGRGRGGGVDGWRGGEPRRRHRGAGRSRCCCPRSGAGPGSQAARLPWAAGRQREQGPGWAGARVGFSSEAAAGPGGS